MGNKWGVIGLVVLIMTACSQETINENVKPDKPVVKLAESDQRAYNKALWDIKEKRFTNAHVILDKLILKYPEAAGPYANKGVIFSKRKMYDKAESYFLKALDKNAKLVQARNHLAVVYRIKGKFKQAKAMLDAAIVTDPYYANAYYNLGILYELYLQVPEKALENYQLYLDLKKSGDKQVAQWVSILQRQIKAGK